MCLAVPAKIVTIDEMHALVEIMGVRQRINIQLIDSPAPGDCILIHAGFAIEKIDPQHFSILNKALYECLE